MNNACNWIAALAMLVGAPLHAATERAEEQMHNALEMDGNVQHGAALYRAQCANCHGVQAHGDAKRGIPNLAGQRRAYLIKQLADFVERDRITTQMHRVVQRAEVIEPQSWADVALYLNGLEPPKSVQTGSGKYLALGEASYSQWCATCHEDDARGDDEGFVPSLRNQHYDYLVKETRALSKGHRFNVEPELGRFLSSLEQDEVEGLADYLSRMHGSVKDRAKLNKDGTVSD